MGEDHSTNTGTPGGSPAHHAASSAGVGPPASTPAPESASSSRYLILTAFAVAVLLRALWAIRYGLSLEAEGVEYTRIAENLLAGRGYVGIFANGTQLNFPPLYPILIAAASLVLPSTEIAARAINVVLGAALVIPAFKIAEQLYGRRAAIAVAALVTLHPVLIAGSASTFAEIPYLTLLISGLFWLMRWVSDRRMLDAVLAGVFFGLAYLVRPEAFVLVGEFTALGLAGALVARDRRAVLRGALALALAFAVVAAPNVIFLTKATGKVRIEAKGTLAYEWGRRINEGMSYQEAVKGIGEDLSDQGVFMRPNLEVINSASYTFREYVTFVLRAVRRNVGQIDRTVVDEKAFGSPVLFMLVIVAIFRTGWTRQRVLLDGLMVLTAGTVVAILGTVQELWFRYFYSLLGIFLIWGGKGACDLGEWTTATVGSLTSHPRVRRLAGPVATAAAIAAVLGLAWRSIGDVTQFQESRCGECARAGRWLSTQVPAHKWVMAGGDVVAYYAGADLMYLPYARSELAIQYVAKRKPDFIVLETLTADGFPYTRQWFEQGIPDPRAELIHEESGPAARIKIYRWRDPAPSP